jgi:hypothetical protein
MKTLYLLAKNYDAKNNTQLAAETYEDYAMKYPAEKESHDALLRAIALRLQLSQVKRAKKDYALMQKQYGGQYGGRPARREQLQQAKELLQQASQDI